MHLKISPVSYIYTPNSLRYRWHPTRDITDYLIRAENASTELKVADETISDNLLIAMILKGLPSAYETFVIVQNQTDTLKTLSALKASLITYASTTLNRESGNAVMKASYNSRHRSLLCHACGKKGHRSQSCSLKDKLSCTFCGSKGMSNTSASRRSSAPTQTPILL